MKSLVVVESPAKAKTINKILGKNYLISACYGHIKDLPAKDLGIDIERDFQPHYLVISGKRKILKELRQKAEGVDKLYLAMDPDREGEAIAFHLWQELGENKLVYRVMFNEITPQAIRQSFSSPGKIDHHKVEAQQARRILDRLVGYKISPLLWRKVKRGLSAGRVQSVAVRLIVEKEKEIENFSPEEYWSVSSRLQGSLLPSFWAKLEKILDKKVKVENEDEAKNILNQLIGAKFEVHNLEKKEGKKNPPPPFITSSLQQEASRRSGFSPARTMRIAQGLYEQGLITYMRTDSVRIAEVARKQARQYIKEKFGKELLPLKPVYYKSRKTAQEAHEAIRPTDVYKEPSHCQAHLHADQYRLYKLIWERFLASQMKHSLLEITIIEIKAGEYLFRAKGQVLKDKGFMLIYEGKENEEAKEEKEERQPLPLLKKGETLDVLELMLRQDFSRAPLRYNEASLVRTLEEKGIGRPSTYAPIIETIQARGYARKERIISLPSFVLKIYSAKKEENFAAFMQEEESAAEEKNKLIPTQLGRIVNDLLVESFPLTLDLKFTAGMEERLDEIEQGKINWQEVIRNFYTPFSEKLKAAEEQIKKIPRVSRPSEEICPQCGSPMVIREGRFGEFLACSSYPKCKTTKSLPTGIACPQPDCKGEVVPRRTKKGRTFYGCSLYPQCKFISWQLPRGVRS